jgi:uncharacterized protein YbaP (TraB family)
MEAHKAISSASRIVFEADVSQPLDLSVRDFGNGDCLSRVIGSEAFSQVQAVCSEMGLATGSLEKTKPWAISNDLCTALRPVLGLTHPGLDEWTMRRAKKDRKTLVYLESRQAGVMAISDSPMEEQVRGLKELLSDRGAYIARTKAFIRMWRERRSDELLERLYERIQQYPRTWDRLLNARHQKWAPKLVSYARDLIPTVAVVGIFHLLGEQGLPKMFARSGYVVRCVDAVTAK